MDTKVLSHSMKNFYDFQMKSTLQGTFKTASDMHRGWQKSHDMFANLENKTAVSSAMVHLMPMQGCRALYSHNICKVLCLLLKNNKVLVLRTAVFESQLTTETYLRLRYPMSPTFLEDKA